MNKRSLITIIAFLVPAIAVITIMSTREPEKLPSPPLPVNHVATLDELLAKRNVAEARLEKVKKMTQEDWDKEGTELGDRAKFRAPSLAEAIKKNEERVADLDKQLAALKAQKTP